MAKKKGNYIEILVRKGVISPDQLAEAQHPATERRQVTWDGDTDEAKRDERQYESIERGQP